MPLFECEKCHCVENTATGAYWGRDEKLCSECATGDWHKQFKKKSALGRLIDQNGYLWTEDQVRSGALPKHYIICGVVWPDDTETWHDENEEPEYPGWYEVDPIDDRFDGKVTYRAWGNDLWWTPLKDGWLSSRMGIYRWRGPVANVDGPAPDGTNPR